MSRAAINANVTTKSERNIGADLKHAIKNRMGFVEFCDLYDMTPNAVYDRIANPDKFTLGQLREMRVLLGMTKDEMVALVRWAI